MAQERAQLLPLPHSNDWKSPKPAISTRMISPVVFHTPDEAKGNYVGHVHKILSHYLVLVDNQGNYTRHDRLLLTPDLNITIFPQEKSQVSITYKDAVWDIKSLA
jgi:hypothetical protein